MKNHLLKFFALFIVSGLILLSSCGEDEEVVPPQPATILFNPDLSTFEGEPGDVVETKVSVSAPSGLISLDISKTVGSGTPSEYEIVTPDAGSNQLFYDFSYTLIADEVGETVVFDFVVKEQGTETAEAKKTITVTVNSPTARSYTAVLLDAPLGDKSGESFFSTNTGATYSPDSVNATNDPLSADIDFGYYYGATNMASLASPLAYSSLAGLDAQVAGWGTLNDIVFRTTSITAEGFLGITTYADIDDAFENGTDAGHIISKLTEGQVVAFETDADKADGSKKGVLHVVEIVEGDGVGKYIKLEIVVQEAAE